MKILSTHNFACSTEAGKFLFGKKDFKIIPNAIEVEKYRFSSEIRKEGRKKLKIKDELVIGHIGRFEQQKNHKYIIDIFKEVLKENPTAVLILAGNGNLFEKIKLYAYKMKVEKNIKFLGVVKDTNKLYQIMDCFILPSFFEGLPVVGIEAQTSGVKCLFSNSITEEVKIIESSEFLDIGRENIDTWKEKILAIKKYDRESAYEKVKYTNYNIKITAKEMEDFYITTYQGDK